MHGLQGLTVETVGELQAADQLGPEEAQVVGAVVEVIGEGSVQGDRVKPLQRQLSEFI